MKKKPLRPAESFSVHIAPNGTLQAQVSKASGEFVLAPEILEVLCLLQQGYTRDTITKALAKKYRDAVDKLPSAPEVNAIIDDLIACGFVIDDSIKNKINTGIFDGFGDPWVQWAMIADKARMQKYFDALQKVVTHNSVVVDVGAGTGALSAFALSLGASKVFAIEETSMAASINKIISASGISVTKRNFDIQNCNSFEAKMPINCNIIVSELFGNDPLAEGVIGVLHNIYSKLTNKNVTFIPESFEVWGEVINLQSGPLFHRIAGFINPDKTNNMINSFCRAAGKILDFSNLSFVASVQPHEFTQATASASLLKIPLNPPPSPASTVQNKTSLSCTTSANYPVFMMWFRVKLINNIYLSSSPTAADKCEHWSPVLVPLTKPISKGEKLEIQLTSNQNFDGIDIKISNADGIIGQRIS